MLTVQEAHAICYSEINRPDPSWPEKPEIIIVNTDETKHSWVFNYQSRPYVENGDFSQSLVGNGPCVVLKTSGKFAFTATFPTISERVAETEKWLLSQGTAGGRTVVAHS